MMQLPQYSEVLMLPQCYAELVDLVQNDEIAGFTADYEQRISYLRQHIGQETFHRAWFEVLKNGKGLRSIRFVKFRNLRILYTLENGRAILLLAFEERKGHKITEYSNYIDPALKRFEEGKSR